MIERVSLGMDIGGTGLRAALVDSAGRIRSDFIDVNRRPDTLNHIDKVIKSLTIVAKKENLNVSAVGMGVAGLVDPKTDILVSSPTMVSMEGVNFRAEIEQISGLPTVVSNDANSAGYAEWRLGSDKDTHSAVALFVGTGVGGAIILDKKLYLGKDGVAGEVGHLVVAQEGPNCPCGGRGCLEQLASGTAAQRYVANKLDNGAQSILVDAYSRNKQVSGQEILAAARSGDSLSVKAYEEIGGWLGVGVSSLANLLNIEVAILGGGAMAAHEFIMPSVRRKIEVHTMKVQKASLQLKLSQFDREAGTIGAALLALEKSD